MNGTTPLKIGLLCSLVSLFPASALGQDLALDWATRTVTSCPANLVRSTLQTKVSNVNDVLYHYAVQAKVTASYPNDAALFLPSSPTIAPAGAGPSATCNTARSDADAAEKKLREAFDKHKHLKPVPDKNKYPSVLLADTQTAWKSLAALYEAFDKAMKALPCPATDDLKSKWDFWKGFDEKVNGDHVITETIGLVVGADNEIVVQVSEFLKVNDKLVLVDEVDFEACKVKSDALSLSLGPLFSTIPNRVYSNQSLFPTTTTVGADGRPVTQSATTGTNTLVVQGQSRVNTVGAALLNYRLPTTWLEERAALSFSISAGPTFRFAGADAKSSRIGFFAGASASLWRRLFLTPGVHLGEFADYPAGLAPYSTIPSAYPAVQLDGVRRWTAKFGIAISFRTHQFSSLDIGLTKAVAAPKQGEDESADK